MNTHTDYQIIKDTAGKPAFVVIPYGSWVKQTNITAGLIPNEVAGAVIEDDFTPFRACVNTLGSPRLK
jgi:hypothetical protein